MRFDDYVAARRTRLVEHAEACGAVDPTALVDAVLLRERRYVERADDPDLGMYDAVTRAAEREARGGLPEEPAPRGRWVLAAAAAVVLLAAAGWWSWSDRGPDPASPDPDGPAPVAGQVEVPTLFGRDAAQAGDLLRAAGLRVEIETVPQCDPVGQVIGSEPAGGTRAAAGSLVRVLSAGTPDDPCVHRADRAVAWAFAGFARGGPAPAFAGTVRVFVDGQESMLLLRGTADDPARWGAVLTDLGDTFAEPARSGTSVPELVVRPGVPPPRRCDVRRPPTVGDRETLRLQLQPDPARRLPCPLTVDLYRVPPQPDGTAGGAIDTVVIYRADLDVVTKWS